MKKGKIGGKQWKTGYPKPKKSAMNGYQDQDQQRLDEEKTDGE